MTALKILYFKEAKYIWKLPMTAQELGTDCWLLCTEAGFRGSDTCQVCLDRLTLDCPSKFIQPFGMAEPELG